MFSQVQYYNQEMYSAKSEIFQIVECSAHNIYTKVSRLYKRCKTLILINVVQEIKGEQAVLETEEPAIKIGRYSVEERKDRISRYLKKRHQRNFNKTIKVLIKLCVSINFHIFIQLLFNVQYTALSKIVQFSWWDLRTVCMSENTS